MGEFPDKITLFFQQDNPVSPLGACLNELSRMPSENTMSKSYLIFSAFDLLTQFHYGALDKKQVAKRIKKFWVKYGKLSAGNAELLLQFRNAVIHNYGQLAFDMRTKREYRFINEPAEKLIEMYSRSVINIDVNRLEKMLLRCVENYKTDLKDQDILQQHFETCYRKMGRLFQKKQEEI